MFGFVFKTGYVIILEQDVSNKKALFSVEAHVFEYLGEMTALLSVCCLQRTVTRLITPIRGDRLGLEL